MVCKWVKIWKVRVLPRVIAFGWIAMQKKILALDNLRRRRLIVVNACPMCLNDEETVDHLLVQCRVLAICGTQFWGGLGVAGCSYILSCSSLRNDAPLSRGPDGFRCGRCRS